MAKASPRFYIFHGEDDFTRAQAVDKMRTEMQAIDSAGLNFAEMDGTAHNAADVLSAVSAYPFLADRRLVIVRGMLAWITRSGAGETGKKQVERLLNDLPTLPDWARLVFVESKTLPGKHKILKLADQDPHGFAKAFSVPKNLTQWLMGRARQEYDTELEPQAAHALASVIGDDLRRADNELLKLVSYTDGAPIDEATVSLLTPYTSETKVWDMIDAMANGRGEVAMRLLHQVLDAPSEDGFLVWALLVRQFRLMLLAKEHLTSGGNVAELASVLKIAPYPAGKLPGQIRAFELDDLETIYRKLLEYDTKIKTGQMKITLALDVVVATVGR